jgi:hypothetical protein
MGEVDMKLFPRKVRVAAAASAAAIGVTFASAATIGAAPYEDAATMSSMSNHTGMSAMTEHHNHNSTMSAAVVPTRPGQDAFGAIQEIVGILESDPKTDWSKVDLERLRQHLIDMNEVTLNADARQTAIDDGVSIDVTGSGRTIAAIQRMVTDHAAEVEQSHLRGWSARTEPLSNGARLIVSAADPKEAQHIRALGFIGILVSGHHHQPHHLAMARGDTLH